MAFKIILSCLLLVLSCIASADVFMSLSSENFSESFRISDLVKEEAEDIDRGELIYSHSRFELGGSYNGVGMAYLRRLDGVILHSFDAALIYYYDKRDTQNIPNRDYRYSLDINSVASEGATFFYTYHADDFFIKFNLDIATSDYHYDGLADGIINWQDDTLSATADIEWTYERDVIFDRNVKPAKGELMAGGIVMGGKSKWARHRLVIADVYHNITWKSAPYTRVEANSERIGGYTADGKLKIRPLGSGVDGFRDVKQSFKPRYYLENDINITFGGLLVDLDYVVGQWWPKLGLRIGNETHSAKIKYSTADKSLLLAYGYNKNIEVGVQMDDWSYKKARRFNLNLGLRLFEF